MLEEIIDPLIIHEHDTQNDEHDNLLFQKDLFHIHQNGSPLHYILLVRHSSNERLAKGEQLGGLRDNQI